jgi:hypothetical protein
MSTRFSKFAKAIHPWRSAVQCGRILTFASTTACVSAWGKHIGRSEVIGCSVVPLMKGLELSLNQSVVRAHGETSVHPSLAEFELFLADV